MCLHIMGPESPSPAHILDDGSDTAFFSDSPYRVDKCHVWLWRILSQETQIGKLCARRTSYDYCCTPKPPAIQVPDIRQYELPRISPRALRLVVEADDAITRDEEPPRPSAVSAE